MSFDSAERVFRDRQDAGLQLAEWFVRSRPAGELIVLGLPRGGVPVAYELATALQAPLDVFVVRKLGAPFNPELAVGAIATGGVIVYNREILPGLDLRRSDLESMESRERAELERRERAYRGGRPPAELHGKTVILVDDGIATGATMRAAVEAARASQPHAIIVAAPTGSREAVRSLVEAADSVAVLSVPDPYVAVGAWYEYFPQLSDQDVVAYLEKARADAAGAPEPKT